MTMFWQISDLKNENKKTSSPKTVIPLTFVLFAHRVQSAHQSYTKVTNNYARFGLYSEQKLISIVLFIKCIQLITVVHQRKSQPIQKEEVWKAASTLGTRETQSREKNVWLPFYLWQADSWGKLRGLWIIGWRIELWALPLISLYLPGFRCVSASIFCISLYHLSTWH